MSWCTTFFKIFKKYFWILDKKQKNSSNAISG